RSWPALRPGLRRMRGPAAIDPGFERAVRARAQRRREGLRAVLGRFAQKYHRPSRGAPDEMIDIVHTLTSFDTFDNLAGTTHGPEDVVPVVRRLVHAILELDEGASASRRPNQKSKGRSKRCP